MARVVGDGNDVEFVDYHPWDEWLNGKLWALEFGVDFGDPEDQKDEAIQTFRTMAWHAAKRRGLKIRTWTEGDELMMVARKRAVVED